jgi:hypothetical protein
LDVKAGLQEVRRREWKEQNERKKEGGRLQK